MANKISVEIELAGGALIEQQLADMGEAGKKAFNDINAAAEKAGGFKNLRPEEATKALQDFGITAVDVIKKVQTAVKQAGRLESLAQGAKAAEGAFDNLGNAIERVAARFTRSLGPIGVFARALGPVGIVAGAAIAIVAKAAIDTVNAINELSATAIKLNVPIEKLDKLRLGFEAAGISAKGISDSLAAVQGDLDKMALQRVAADAETLKTGIGNTGDAFKRLTDLATKFTPAGNAAAKALLDAGRPVPGLAETVVTLDNVGKTAGFTKQEVALLGIEVAKLKGLTGVEFKFDDTAETRTKKLIEALQKIPDAEQRSAIALQFFQQGSAELAQAMQTGSLSSNNFAADVERDSKAITQATADMVAQLEQSRNKARAAFERFDISGAMSEMKTLTGLVAGISWNAVSSAGVAAWNAISGAIGSSINGIGSFMTSLGTITWDAISGVGVAAWNALTAAIQETTTNLREFLALQPGGGPSPAGGAAPGHAAGGLLGGRGSGTSDSNLAWVSRGEYIVPAAAVAQPGVLAFLEALRRGMGHFALGGMVRGPLGIPAMAGGGMNNVTINFPGLPEITGLRASSGVVDQLHRAAAMAQVRSGGRKPSRYT
jgi:hypothetical protein